MAGLEPAAAAPRRRLSLLAVAAGVAMGGVVVILVVLLAGRGKVNVRAGNDRFEVGRADLLTDEVDRRGPLLFQDPLGRGRHVYVAHLGGRRWEAFEARLPNGCRLVLDRARKRLRDQCTGKVVADTSAATHYRVEVDDNGKVVVDLRARLGP